MKMKNVLFILLLSCSSILFSQEHFFDKVRYGGDFGFSFSSNSTTLFTSPTAIYDFNEHFSAGLGFGYWYNSRENSSYNAYGPSIIVLYRPIRTIEFSSSLQQIYASIKTGTYTEKRSYPSLNLGAAYRVGAFSFGIQYDVLHDKEKSLHTTAFSPFIRVFI